jgi:hypothetical protein
MVMDYNDFVRIVMTSWPDAIIDENPYGELIIHTNHKLVGDLESDHKLSGGKVVRMSSEEPF